MAVFHAEVQFLSRVCPPLRCGRRAAETVGADQFLGRQGWVVGALLHRAERHSLVDYLQLSPHCLEILEQALDLCVHDLELLLRVLFVALLFQLFHQRTHIQVLRQVVDLFLQIVEGVCPLRRFVQVTLHFLDPAFEVHVAQVLLENLLDEVAVFSGVDLGHLVGEAFCVLLCENFQVHEFLFQFPNLFLMELDLVGNFTDQVRVESFEDVRDVLHFFEAALLAVEFFDLILESDDLLFNFLFFAEVVFSEFDKLVVFSGELIGLVFEL